MYGQNSNSCITLRPGNAKTYTAWYVGLFPSLGKEELKQLGCCMHTTHKVILKKSGLSRYELGG